MYDGTYVTLNISSTSVRLLSVRGRQVRKWGSAPLPPGLVKDGLILRPKVVGAVIGALFKSTEVPRDRVVTSLTGLSFIYRIMSLPRMEADSQGEAIRRAARKEMPLPLEELYLSWQAIDGGQDELEFFVLGVPRNLIDALVQTLGEAGVKPYAIDLNPLALARAANRENAIIVALEPDCFDIVVVADGMPVIMHAITPKGERAGIEDNIRRLIDELSKTVEFYNSNHPQNPLSPDTPLLLTGELSTDAATEPMLAGLGYPVEFLAPPLELPSDLPAASFATNIGLALKKLPPKPVAKEGQALFRDINLNILAGERKPLISRLKLSYLLLSLVVVIGLGLLVPMNIARSQAHAETERLQTELTGVNQELDQALQALDSAGEIEATIDAILAEAATIKQEQQYLLSGSGDYAYNLKLVTNALPYEAYFNSIEADADRINVSGDAEGPFTVVAYAMALGALDRFSEVRIVSIDETSSSWVSFEIVISQ